MACPICKNNNYTQPLYIKDYEYNINLTEKYLTCSSCYCIYRERSIIEKKEEKLLYSKSIYKPLKGGIIYDFLKKINAYYEKTSILKNIIIENKNTRLHVLDIACGKGFLLNQLAKNKQLKCFGIDLNIDNENSNIKFIKTSYDNLHVIKEINADIIIINNFIEHMEDLKPLISIIEEMKKNSNMIIITPNTNSKGKKFFKSCWSGYHSPRHKMVFNENNILKAFTNIKNINFKLHKIYDPFTNIISMMNIYKELKNNFSFKILLKLLISPTLILLDIIDKNRILLVVKKD
jgi:2-polyprenyl-3-methyl-5-hydroxy-6-metoxy-1,4-benzoquinol methylase